MENNFLQSKEWRNFQKSVGRRTFLVTSPQHYSYKGEGAYGFSASIIEHKLPVVGKPACIAKRSILGRYFYIPKGPIIKKQEVRSKNKEIQELIDLAKKEKAGWIRIEPENESVLQLIKENTKNKIVKAPHDMQPKETLIMDISKSEEEILAGMKSKTRYNIKLAKKKGIKIKNGSSISIMEVELPEFLRLTKIMSSRQGIVTHENEYYRKMFEVIPDNILKLYVAEYDGKIIAANIVVHYGDTAYYLHGASDDKYRNLMAPHLLQWRQIQDARKAGCTKYDFCGVKVKNKNGKSWEGITRFKLGFSPKTETIEFPGSYDIVISFVKYWVYRFLQFVISRL